MKDLLAVIDELNHARKFVECAWMACQFLNEEHGGPLTAVLDTASDKLLDIRNALDKIGQDGSEVRS